jgi:hypothetical protein
MGGKLLGPQGKNPGNERTESQNDPAICQEQKKDSPLEAQNLVEVLQRTVKHFFPWWNQWLDEIPDPRNRLLIDYELKTLIWAGILMFMSGRRARKQIGQEMRTSEMAANLTALSGQKGLEKAPHGDTLEYSMVRSRHEYYEEVKTKMIRRLIRRRALENQRLLGIWYTVAIDGVHVYSFTYKHCERCVYRERGVWMHLKLVASLVTPNGFCFPLVSEWIENQASYDKQDCELKALYRMIPKLRRLYPKLRLCLLLDSLFCGEPTFELLKQHGMEGIVVFKEGSMPEVWDWVMRMVPGFRAFQEFQTQSDRQIQQRRRRSHDQRILRTAPQYQTRSVVTGTRYQWLDRIQHWDERRHFNILMCEQICEGKNHCHYVWQITDGIPLNKTTVEELANAGGRCRWKIKNQGFNTQKNGGYELEHPYSTDEVSMKCYNELLDIAHILRQLIEKGSLICVAALGGPANLGKRLFEHLRYRTFVAAQNPPPIQIRFAIPDTS